MILLKKITSQLLPPIFFTIIKRFKALLKSHDADKLFNGDDSMFKEQIKTTKVYGEYGAGQSTHWVLNNTRCKIHSVDTSDEWVKFVQSNTSERLDIRWVNLGSVGCWGRPNSYEKRDDIPNYLNSIWQRKETPDLVLIDGRFRVACFLSTLLNAPTGSRIIFDDYTNRKRYHIIEEIIKPTRLCGRQAMFLVPSNFDKSKTSEMLNKFTYVMD